jgi:hypothetical protein
MCAEDAAVPVLAAPAACSVAAPVLAASFGLEINPASHRSSDFGFGKEF